MHTFDIFIIATLSPELISLLGLAAGASTFGLGLRLIRQNTHLVFDRTDVLLIGSVLILVGIDYLLVSAGQPRIRTQALSRIAWATIFVGGLGLSVKYHYKIYKERREKVFERPARVSNIG